MLQIKKLMINHRCEPLGLDAQPRFSWKLESDGQNVIQRAYRIWIGSIYDSAVVESDQSIGVTVPELTLEPLTCYPVSLQIWDNYGQTAEAEAWFETGLLQPEKMQAQWITHTLPEEDTACPVFIKHFSANEICKGRLILTACGVYSAKLNGQYVSDALLSPGWTNYRERLQYQIYEVTELLQPENTLEITVAPGWYSGYLNGEGKNHHYGNRVALLAQLHLWNEAGKETVFCSDESWTFATGEIRFAELYHGEAIDKAFPQEAERSVQLCDGIGKEKLVAQQGPAVRITDRIKPQAMLHSPKGEVILDFGQNISGVVELKIRGQQGQKIVLRHGEVLDREGDLYTTNLRTARATDTFICSGGDDVFCPRFTFHGFRYAAVEGLGEDFDPNMFTACALHSDMEHTGSFSCSNPDVNCLWSNIRWGMVDNFVDIPSDCPQRDERLGWTGDAAIFSHTAGQLYDVYTFFEKWLADLASEQSREYGVPDTIPNILMPPGTPCGGSAVWGDSAALVPWSMYQHYGEQDILERQYESIKDWVEHIRSTETPQHLHFSGHQRGDWLALDREEGKGNRGYTDPYLISTAFYAESTRILAESAAVLGYAEDAADYKTLNEQIREGFLAEFFTPTGRLVSETQTACALVLCLNLVDEGRKARVIETLKRNLVQHQGHLTTGFIGTPYLCKALSRNGCHDMAGKLLLSEDYPGWLREVKLGATTVWERWDSMHDDGTFDESGMNSFNHYSFGAVGDWLVEDLAGIQALEPGYHRSRIAPQFVQGITHAQADRETPYGKLSCAWHCENGKITVDIAIPANTCCEVLLPEQTVGRTLGSGEYHFEYETTTDLTEKRYSADTKIGVLAEDARFPKLMDRLMPGSSASLGMEFVRQKSLRELLLMMPSNSEQLCSAILQEMNQ